MKKMTFLPWQEVDQRDCNGITWHQRIPEKKNFLQINCSEHLTMCLDCKNIANCIYMIAYSAEGFLKASGWMELMLSPLSQVILARLAFRS